MSLLEVVVMLCQGLAQEGAPHGRMAESLIRTDPSGARGYATALHRFGSGISTWQGLVAGRWPMFVRDGGRSAKQIAGLCVCPLWCRRKLVRTASVSPVR